MIWVDTKVPFGGVAGCGTFGKVADMWRKIIQRHLKIDRIFRWVDDNMIVRKKGSHLQLKDVLDISARMGVKTNAKKLHDFADEQKYLGFIFNGVEKTVRLPADKLYDRLDKIREMLQETGPWSQKHADTLIGEELYLKR
jgi:hypothetical protein